MQLANSPTRYGALPQAIHWLTALCVIGGWLLGQFIDAFPKGSPQALALSTHVTLGQSVIVLLIARLVWRIVDPPPALEAKRFGRLLNMASRLSHYALYALLVAAPVLGVIVQFKRGHDLPIFGLWHVASPWPADRATARNVLEGHELLANALLILAAFHAAAALIHHYVFRDNTLTRMLPGST